MGTIESGEGSVVARSRNPLPRSCPCCKQHQEGGMARVKDLGSAVVRSRGSSTHVMPLL